MVARYPKTCLAFVVVGILLFALSTTYMNWVKYVSLRSTYAYDLGFYHNTAFNHAHGRTITYLLVSSWFGRNEHNGPSLFRSTHFSPLQLLLLPQLYRVWPQIETLMFLQSIIIGLGALPLFLFGTQRTHDPLLGLILAASYLLHPVILHMAFNDYRPIQLGIPFALFALWLHASRKPLAFLLSALLMLFSRPEYIFLLALFEVINWRLIPAHQRNIYWLLAPLLLAALWTLLTNAYYLYFYGIPWPLIAKQVTGEPSTSLLAKLFERLPAFLRITLLPGGVALLTPEALALALPFVIGAGTVRWPAFPHHDLQHLSPAVAIVFWAFASAMVRLWPWLAQNQKRATWTKVALLTAALLSFAHFGWGAARAYLVGGYPRYEELTRTNQALPADATVMVPKALTARFSNHSRVLTHRALPVGTSSRLLFAEEVKAIFAELISVCDFIATEEGEDWLDNLVIQSGRYLPARRVGRFHIFVAREEAQRAPDADARVQRILRWNEMSAIKRRLADIVAD